MSYKEPKLNLPSNFQCRTLDQIELNRQSGFEDDLTEKIFSYMLFVFRKKKKITYPLLYSELT
jgi:hypothetical protein